jgi:hypothetical protein
MSDIYVKVCPLDTFGHLFKRKKFLDILWHFEQDSLKRKHNLFTGKSQVKIASCSNYEYFEQ